MAVDTSFFSPPPTIGLNLSDMTSETNDLVFLLDVDNTLLDTDRITEELKNHLVIRVGKENASVY